MTDRQTDRQTDRRTDRQTSAPFHDMATHSGPHNKAATNGGKRRAEHSRRRPSSVVRTRRRRSVCDGLDVIYAGDGGPPRTPQPPWSKDIVAQNSAGIFIEK